jgi:hypothetical protein
MWELGGLKMKWQICSTRKAGIHEPYSSPGLFFSGKIGPDNPREGKSAWAHSIVQDAYWAAEASKPAWSGSLKTEMMGYKKLKNRDIVQDKFGLKHFAETMSLYETDLFLSIGRLCPNLWKWILKGQRSILQKAGNAGGYTLKQCTFLLIANITFYAWSTFSSAFPCLGWIGFLDNIVFHHDTASLQDFKLYPRDCLLFCELLE